MWKRVSVFIAAVLIAVPLFAQCPGGVCPRPGNPGIIDSVPPGQPKREYGPVAQKGTLLSIVRIIGVETAGSNVKGSGTYVNYEGFYCVVTASHVVRGTKQLYVVFHGSEAKVTVQGIVLANDPTNDVAVIGLYKHPVDGEDIAASVAYSPDLANIEDQILSNYGYGSDDVLCGGPGRVIGERCPAAGLPKSWYVISSFARLGDSGGPVFLQNGKLAGVLWGRAEEDDGSISSVLVTKCGYIHAQLRVAKSKVSVEEVQCPGGRCPVPRANVQAPGVNVRVQPRPLPRQANPLVPVVPFQPPVLPWRDKIENEIDGIKKAPPVDPKPPVVAPAPPKVDVDVKPTKPAEPPVANDGRYRVDRQIALYIILSAMLLCLVAGVAVQWNKTYSIK